MEDYPKTMIELEERFRSEEDCRGYLAKLRWPEGFRCPRCGHDKTWAKSNGLKACQRCGLQTSPIAGTIFQDTKKPLVLWFRAMWHVTSQKYGANALGVQRVLGLGSYRTAWAWLHKLRRAMVRPGRDRLSGVVQVDEMFVGGERTGKRGRGAEGKTLVLVVAQEDGTRVGRIRLGVIQDASAASLEAALADMAEPGTIIRTDGWSGYNRLEEKGYVHEVIRKDAHIGEDLLPYCHRVASLLKRWLLGTHQGAVSHNHLPYYLDEFTFRFNRRSSNSRGKLFYRLVQQAAVVEPVPVKSLIKNPRRQKQDLNIQ
jgi:transposase-like protein